MPEAVTDDEFIVILDHDFSIKEGERTDRDRLIQRGRTG